MRPFLFVVGFIASLVPMQAATVTFTASGTVTSTLGGSTGTVNATVTFSTFQDIVQVQIWNNIVGASRDIQAVGAVDFILSTGQTNATLASRSGLVRTIASDGSWTAGDTTSGKKGTGPRPANFSDSSYNGEWGVVGGLDNALVNSITLTAFTGGNPQLTIFGAPAVGTCGTSTSCYNAYGNPNNAVTGHNPYLASDGQPIIYTLSVPGVTIGTTILPNNAQVRFFFGTDRTAFLNGTPVSDTPEPGSFALMGLGVIGLSLLRGKLRSL